MNFQAGDRIRIIQWCSGTHVGDEYNLIEIGDTLWAGARVGDRCHCQGNWELVAPTIFPRSNILFEVK